jgi:hypothetical protein
MGLGKERTRQKVLLRPSSFGRPPQAGAATAISSPSSGKIELGNLITDHRPTLRLSGIANFDEVLDEISERKRDVDLSMSGKSDEMIGVIGDGTEGRV